MIAEAEKLLLAAFPNCGIIQSWIEEARVLNSCRYCGGKGIVRVRFKIQEVAGCRESRVHFEDVDICPYCYLEEDNDSQGRPLLLAA